MRITVAEEPYKKLAGVTRMGAPQIEKEKKERIEKVRKIEKAIRKAKIKKIGLYEKLQKGIAEREETTDTSTEVLKQALKETKPVNIMAEQTSILKRQEKPLKQKWL